MQSTNMKRNQSATIKDDPEELENRKQGFKCVWRHNNKWRIRWDLAVIVLVVYNCISIPFEVAFEQKFTEHVILDILDFIIDAIFFLDLVINFFTTYVNSKTGREEYSLKKISLHYLSGRFWVDLLASVPFELLFAPFVQNQDTVLQIFGLMKLVRLLRLG